MHINIVQKNNSKRLEILNRIKIGIIGVIRSDNNIIIYLSDWSYTTTYIQRVRCSRRGKTLIPF